MIEQSTDSPRAIAAPDLDRAFPAWMSLVLIASISSIYMGLIWDISWHMTIGRDTFWTPAHIAIYSGGALPGLLCGFLAIKITFFGTPAEKSRAVSLWGGRGPFGGWIVIWGAVAMLTAGPFDDWWHSAYGLDVKIISPPHVVLFIGVFAVFGGTLVFLVREMNVGQEGGRLREILFCYAAGAVLGMYGHVFLNEGYPNHQHGARYYVIFSWLCPGLFMLIRRVTRLRWGATLCALSYLGILGSMVWILPRFAAVPKLGPVLNPVDHMVPPYFPHLVFVPALVIDWVHGRFFSRHPGFDWRLVPATAFLFVIFFIAVQWHFSRFLLSPAAENAVFVGNQSWPYSTFVGEGSRLFWGASGVFTPRSLLRIFSAALLSTAAGAWVGTGMRKIIR